jgi:DNA polymerase III subunit gamma/tau
VPITVLSRCQRFDLRRVDAALLVKHLQSIAGKESIAAEPEALALIARAAEGSVRDSLSLFDQAIAHAAGPVRAEDVRQMLGLADRTRVIDLFEALMRADIARALAELRDQYDTGADPAMVLGDLAEFTHFVTRVKIVPAVADDVSLTEPERSRGRAFATKLSMRVLARTWQMLLKGIAEVGNAGRPLAAAEMVLVRIAYAAELPTPDEVIRVLDEKGADARRAGEPAAASLADVSSTRLCEASRLEQPRPALHAAAAPAASGGSTVLQAGAEQKLEPLMIARFEDLIALAIEKRDLGARRALERDVRLVRCEDGRLEVRLEPSAAKTLVNDLARKISQWTNRPWIVVVSVEEGQPTVKAQNDARSAELKTGVRADPLVQAVLARFPGAEIVDVRKGGALISGQTAPGDGGEAGPELPGDESAFGARSARVALPGHEDA